MADILREILDLAATLPSRHETLGLVLIVPRWTSAFVLQLDGPHTRESLMARLGRDGIEAWEHVRTRSEYRILIGGPALERGMRSLASTSVESPSAYLGVPVVRLARLAPPSTEEPRAP